MMVAEKGPLAGPFFIGCYPNGPGSLKSAEALCGGCLLQRSHVPA